MMKSRNFFTKTNHFLICNFTVNTRNIFLNKMKTNE